MRCAHFRILITMLAAFGPFMAYVCRLNLSLIIEEMVANGPEMTISGGDGDQPDIQVETSRPRAFSPEVTREHADLARRLPQIFNEDQSLAELSSGGWWRLKNRQRQLLDKKLRLPNNRTAQLGLPPLLPPPPPNAQLLSISFDASPGAQNARDQSSPAQQQQQQQPPLASTSASTESTSTEAPSTQETTTTTTTTSTTTNHEGELLHWSKDNRNDLLGAFFLGYVIFQVPAGRAAELFGPKLLFMVLGLGTGLSSLIFPLACRWSNNIWLAYSVRFLMGASQAGLFPACYVLLCNWLPKNERTSWLAVPSAMGRIGTIAMNFAVPAVMGHFTWEWVFYLSGFVTLIWALIWLVLGSDQPATSAWLSHEELVYIESRMESATSEQPAWLEPPVAVTTKTMAGRQRDMDASRFSLDSANTLDSLSGECEQIVKGNGDSANGGARINWLKMLRSRALLILTLVMFTSEWCNMLLLIKLPGFLGPALKMDLEEVGLWSSILVAIYCVQYPLAGFMASRLEAAELQYFDSLRVRKLFELSAHLMQASACLIIALFENKIVVLTSLVLMMFGRSTVGGGQCLMPPELSRDYPGTVMAVANSMANVAGVIGPLVVTLLVDEPSRYESWQTLWLLSAGIFLFGGGMFCLLADNRPQNYCKKPKLIASKSTSRAQLVLPPYVAPPQMTSAVAGDNVAASLSQDNTKARQRATTTTSQKLKQQAAPVTNEPEIMRMDAFARVSSEPPPNE